MNPWNSLKTFIGNNPVAAIIIVGFLALWVWYDTLAIKAVRTQRQRQSDFDAIFPNPPPAPIP